MSQQTVFKFVADNFRKIDEKKWAELVIKANNTEDMNSAELFEMMLCDVYHGQNSGTEKVFGETVKLPADSFKNSTRLHDFTSPQAMKNIGDYAFENSQGLKNVNLPYVTEIGEGAFKDCKQLRYIDLGNVESIGDEAFLNCRSLKIVHAPKTLRTIGRRAFQGCLGLTLIFDSLEQIEQLDVYETDINWFENGNHIAVYEDGEILPVENIEEDPTPIEEPIAAEEPVITEEPTAAEDGEELGDDEI